MLAAAICPVLRLRAGVRRILSRHLVRSQVEPLVPRRHEVRLAPAVRALDARAVLGDRRPAAARLGAVRRGQFHGWLLGSSFSLIGLASGLLAFVRTMQPPKSRAEKQASWAIPEQLDRLDRRRRSCSTVSSWCPTPSAGGRRKAHPSSAFRRLGACRALSSWPSSPGSAVDLNLITIHRFYRDRLMEAFLPDVDQALRNGTAPAEAGRLRPPCPACATRHGRSGPYHIINTNLVLTKSDERTYRHAGRRQLHPVAALLRQQRDWLAADRDATWATS